MKVNEIREMSAEEQNLKIASLKEELFNLIDEYVELIS